MVPPSRPSIFYGRDILIEELTGLVVNEKHIALIGPGGMGKSSLAKAILNQLLIAERFVDRRFFVTYDALDPSTITFEAFMVRLAEALGTTVAGLTPCTRYPRFSVSRGPSLSWTMLRPSRRLMDHPSIQPFLKLPISQASL
jgi:hypothetical protein